jgi:hypothetical protein
MFTIGNGSGLPFTPTVRKKQDRCLKTIDFVRRFWYSDDLIIAY